MPFASSCSLLASSLGSDVGPCALVIGHPGLRCWCPLDVEDGMSMARRKQWWCQRCRPHRTRYPRMCTECKRWDAFGCDPERFHSPTWAVYRNDRLPRLQFSFQIGHGSSVACSSSGIDDCEDTCIAVPIEEMRARAPGDAAEEPQGRDGSKPQPPCSHSSREEVCL